MFASSSEYEFLLNCGITKAPAVMNLSDKESVISGISLHYGVLESLRKLEQFKRRLKTTDFSRILERSISRQLFVYHHERITADFIQIFLRSNILCLVPTNSLQKKL